MIGIALSMAGNPSQITVIQQAIAVLRRFGTNAHIYLPGVGMLNGLTAANYLDSAGTTAGTVDQPVGLVLDAAGGLGVELVVNGDFSNGLTGWGQTTANFWTATSGRAYHANSANYNEITRTIATTNSPVWIEFDYECLTASNTAQFFYVNGAGVSKTSDVNGLPKLASGIGKMRYFAPDGCQKVGFARYTTAEFYIDNISVREVTGIAASQPTTSAKPILRRGAVNLLTYSGDFGNAAHSKGSVTQGALGADPDGGTNARLFTADPSTLSHQIMEPNTACSAGTYTHMIVVKPSGYTKIGLRESTTTGVYATFDCTGAGSVIASTSLSAGITALSSGFYLLVMTISTGVGNYAVTAHILPNSYSTGAPNIAWAGDGVSGFFFYKVSLFRGTYTAQQIQALGGIPLTTTAPASTALGPYYFQFDGSNDSLSLGGPLFQMADDHCVIAGAMCNAATGTAQIVASLSRDSSTGNSAARLQFDPSGTVSAAWTPTSGSAIITAPGNLTGSVKVLAAHKVGNVKRLRVGGVTAGTDSVVQTDTGMNSAAISDYRVGLQLPFSGAIYPIIGIKGTVPDADLLLLERFVGQLSGVTI